MLVDREMTKRESRRLERSLRAAKLRVAALENRNAARPTMPLLCDGRST